MQTSLAISVRASHAYHARTQPVSTFETRQQTAPLPHTEAVKIELSAVAHNHLSKSDNTGRTTSPGAQSHFDTHISKIAPDGAGRREAPMRISPPVYHPPGSKIDMQV